MKKVFLINLLLKEMSLRGCVDQKITLVDKFGIEKIWRIPRLDVITPSRVVSKEIYDSEDKTIVANQISRLNVYKLENSDRLSSSAFPESDLMTLEQVLITLKCHLLMCAKEAKDLGKSFSGELTCYDIGGSSESFDKITTNTHSDLSFNDLKGVVFQAKFLGNDVCVRFDFNGDSNKFELTSASLPKQHFLNNKCDREWLFLNVRAAAVSMTEFYRESK